MNDGGGAYCQHCRTPYRREDLIEVRTTGWGWKFQRLYVCLWHHAHGMR